MEPAHPECDHCDGKRYVVYHMIEDHNQNIRIPCIRCNNNNNNNDTWEIFIYSSLSTVVAATGAEREQSSQYNFLRCSHSQ